MPAPSSSLIDPAIGELVELAAEAVKEQPGLLGVLARVADPRQRRGVRQRLAVILGLALCAVVAGARSFTAIAEWAADADEATLRALRVTGQVPSESTFRRTVQRLDADAFDEVACAWAQQATAPGPKTGGSSRPMARPCVAPARPGKPEVTCWLPSIMLMAPSWARWRSAPRRTRFPGSQRCWTA